MWHQNQASGQWQRVESEGAHTPAKGSHCGKKINLCLRLEIPLAQLFWSTTWYAWLGTRCNIAFGLQSYHLRCVLQFAHNKKLNNAEGTRRSDALLLHDTIILMGHFFFFNVELLGSSGHFYTGPTHFRRVEFLLKEALEEVCRGHKVDGLYHGCKAERGKQASAMWLAE